MSQSGLGDARAHTLTFESGLLEQQRTRKAKPTQRKLGRFVLHDVLMLMLLLLLGARKRHALLRRQAPLWPGEKVARPKAPLTAGSTKVASKLLPTAKAHQQHKPTKKMPAAS